MSAQFESILGEDLYGLALERGSALTALRPLVGSIGSVSGPKAYRLDFADGSSCKGRRLFSVAHAMRVESWIRTIDDEMLPRVQGRRGAALLLDWVEGCPPLLEGFDPDVHGVCADFQARLHLRRDEALRSEQPRFSLDELVARLNEGSAMLEGQGLLSARELDCLLRVAAAGSRHTPSPVLVHDDLCGENLVIDRSGRVRVIDNEGLRAGYLGHDLARSVYRWGMESSTEERYLERYERTGSAEAFRGDRAFWIAVVLVESAGHRAGVPSDVRELPLSRLRRELAGRERGALLG